MKASWGGLPGTQEGDGPLTRETQVRAQVCQGGDSKKAHKGRGVQILALWLFPTPAGEGGTKPSLQ